MIISTEAMITSGNYNKLGCATGFFYIIGRRVKNILPPWREQGYNPVIKVSGEISIMPSLAATLSDTTYLRDKMDIIEITSVTLNDLDQLKKIGRQTFHETFSSVNTEENMNIYLEDAFSNQKLTAELADKNAEFYFATLDSKVIGYLKLNFGKSQTELKDDKALEIERIYVLKEFHGKKVGQLLYDKAIKVARQSNADYVWLGVWEENLRAISFYKKNGFVEFDKHLFKLGDDEQTDLMMKLQLKNN